VSTTLITLDTSPLLDSLADQQRRVLGILDGLDEDSLRRPVLASGWCCLGMVQHLTLMTRFWSADVMTGAQSAYPADEFQVDGDQTVASVLDAYAQEAEAARKRLRDLSLDTPPAWWPEGQFGDWRLHNLGQVLLHVVVETACHAGHLDAVRELLDGRTWDYEQGHLSDPR